MTELARRSQLDVLEELIEVTRQDLVASNISRPKDFTQVVGSPFILTASWQKVCTTTAATLGLRLGIPPTPTTYDVEWISAAAGAIAPTDVNGEGVLAGEDFQGGLPLGDIYCKSVTGQKLIVKVA